jgi:translation initiation factor IF-2
MRLHLGGSGPQLGPPGFHLPGEHPDPPRLGLGSPACSGDGLGDPGRGRPGAPSSRDGAALRPGGGGCRPGRGAVPALPGAGRRGGPGPQSEPALSGPGPDLPGEPASPRGRGGRQGPPGRRAPHQGRRDRAGRGRRGPGPAHRLAAARRFDQCPGGPEPRPEPGRGRAQVGPGQGPHRHVPATRGQTCGEGRAGLFGFLRKPRRERQAVPANAAGLGVA